jgi:DNA-binding PadR family transcriptional regulator
MHEPLERLFLREKPVLAILAVGELEPAYAALVAKRIDSTFPHTISILSQLEAQGLIDSRHEGRIRYLELTDRGKKVAKVLQELSSLLQRPDVRWTRLERIKQLSASERSSEAAALQLGPLRRDLAKIKSQGDEVLRRAAEELDMVIAIAAGRSLGH